MVHLAYGLTRWEILRSAGWYNYVEGDLSSHSSSMIVISPLVVKRIFMHDGRLEMFYLNGKAGEVKVHLVIEFVSNSSYIYCTAIDGDEVDTM